MAAKFAALLPMKGHSERVKDKNIRDFNGRPLFWHIRLCNVTIYQECTLTQTAGR